VIHLVELLDGCTKLEAAHRIVRALGLVLQARLPL
jgi:hypothetical protein